MFVFCSNFEGCEGGRLIAKTHFLNMILFNLTLTIKIGGGGVELKPFKLY